MERVYEQTYPAAQQKHAENGNDGARWAAFRRVYGVRLGTELGAKIDDRQFTCPQVRFVFIRVVGLYPSGGAN